MNFIATVKLDSELDISLKKTHCEMFDLYNNKFVLTDNTYICSSIINLIPLLDDLDIEIVATHINLVEL